MSYAVQASVTTWVQNLETGMGDLFTQASALCDAQVDADLGNYFDWPINGNNVVINNPPPVYVVQMANLLTASIVENMAYSQMMSRGDTSLDESGGFGGTTYGRMLYGMYKNMLMRLVRGQAYVYQLQRYGSIGMIPGVGRVVVETGLAYDAQSGNVATSAITAQQGGIIDIPAENPSFVPGVFDEESDE